MTINEIYHVFESQSDLDIVEHLKTLPRRQRDALTYKLTGASTREIATHMVISYDSAKTHLRIALNKFIVDRGKAMSDS